MIELEVKLGPKTGLDTVQNEKHVEVEVASPDDSNRAPLVRVTNCILLQMYATLLLVLLVLMLVKLLVL